MAGKLEHPIPVTVLTGFLGSGKTTLLRSLLGHAQFAKTAVLINELGEIGIDHLLVKHVTEQLVLLESGCLCCTLRGDLVKQLELLWVRRESRELPAFERVVVETTGLADPAPILATLLSHPALSERFYVDGVVTAVDAEHANDCLERYPECRKQIGVADRLVLTKVDRVTDEAVVTLAARLAQLAPGVPWSTAVLGAIAPSELVGLGHLDTRALTRTENGLASHVAPAHTGVERISVTFTRPLDFNALAFWVACTTQLHGEHILRLKAVVSAHGEPTPLALQAVQHVVYPPLSLPVIPELAGRSHVVVLCVGLDRAAREQLRQSLLALEPSTQSA